MSNSDQTHGGIALAKGVNALYQEGQLDYSLEPIILVDDLSNPIGRIKDGDTVIFCCRRGEREVQLTEAFTETEFDRFPRLDYKNLTFVPLTLYHEKFKYLPIAFAPTKLKDTLGEIISNANLRQLRVAESEKFAHITFFFNGGNSQPFRGEDDICIESPKGIPFEQVPEMSLARVAGEVIHGINQSYDFIVTNFANGDVIGHTQNNPAKIQCAEIVDAHLGQVVNAALVADYTVLVTADHGNLEEMTNTNGTPNVAHSTNPVSLLLMNTGKKTSIKIRDGKLANIAPTILQLLGIEKPDRMTAAGLIHPPTGKNRGRVLLVILDGWGNGKQDGSNPIYLAQTPVWDDLNRRFPPAQLRAAGDAVGLKAGKAGNSEAGHMSIGAGRVVMQDDVRLDLAMQDGSFFSNQTLCTSLNQVKDHHANLHLIGLLSERSSHGSIDYPLALLKMAKANGLEQVYVHVIFDGRSTEPGTAIAMLGALESQIAEIGIGQIVSGVGRGFALDRAGNYEKTQRAYDALVYGKGKKCVLE